MVRVHVNVSDNNGVDRVELYVDGTLVNTANGGNYTTSWHANQWGQGDFELQCWAYDAAENVGTSQIVTVSH